MNKKAKGGLGIIVIIILIAVGYYFFIYNNGINNPLKAMACTNSGGEWINGDSSMNGVVIANFKYCNCYSPYTNLNNICVKPTVEMMSQCEKHSSTNLICHEYQSNCQCISNTGVVCNFGYQDVVNSNNFLFNQSIKSCFYYSK
jgi:hypothetical protein